jgi:hypothetical protein
MAAQAAAELLETSAAALDRSEALHGELRRLARVAEPAAHAAAAAARDATAAARDAAERPAVAASAAAALADCLASVAAAAGQLRELSAARAKMGELRGEMMGQLERELAADRDGIADQLAAMRRAVDEEHHSRLRAVMSMHGLPAPAAPGPAPAPAPGPGAEGPAAAAP